MCIPSKYEQFHRLATLTRVISTALILATALLPLCNTLHAANARAASIGTVDQANSQLQATFSAENAPGWMQAKRMEWFYAQRAFPSGNIPASARMNAWQEKQRASRQTLDETWTSLGPTSLAGRALSIAWHPTNTNVIYVGSASGGLWKSTNGGTNWLPLTDNLPSLAVGAIALDPANPNIVYVGTGEGAFNVDAVYGAGIFKSTDGGTTWNATGMSWEQFQGRAVNRIIVHPTNSQIIWAATNIANGGGVFKSTDGGANWTLYLEGDARDLAIRTDSVNVLYAALGYPWGGSDNGIYRSSNGGLTWAALTSGLPSSSLMGRIALSHGGGQTMYAGISQTITAGAALLGIYKTTNGGASWTLQASSPDLYGGQGWYNITCEVHPTNSAIAYSSGMDCYKSTDSGVSWTQKTFGSYSPASPQYAHSSHHALAFKPDDPNTIVAATDGGLFKSTNGGDTWTRLNNGLATFQFYATGNDLQNANLLYGGAQDNGSSKYAGGTWIVLYGGDGGYCNVDFTNTNILYAETQQGAHFKSTDGGASFAAIQNGITGNGAWVTPVVMDPANPNVLYTGTSVVYKTDDGGTDWTAISPALSNNNISTIALAPSNPLVIYIGYENGGLIWKTTNGGTNWTSISSGLPMAYVTRLAVHPTDANTVYATFSGYGIEHVWKSTTGGAAWTDITGNLPDVPCNVIVIDPYTPTKLYLGTDLGVYTSLDAGSSWTDFSNGLPNVVVDDLTLHPATGMIRAATHGRGLWQTLTSIPIVTVLYPNGGETWMTGAVQNITWATGGLGGSVRIELNRNYPAGAWETLITSTSNDGSYSWAVSGTTTLHARIRITSIESPPATDVSNADFTIAQPGVTILSPNGGEVWPVGSVQTVSWNAQGVYQPLVLQINRSYPSAAWTTLTSTNSPTYDWTVSGPSTTARFRIYVATNPSLGDTSDANFSIVNPAITVSYPNGGEIFTPGSLQVIRWITSNLSGSVRVELNPTYPSGAWDTLAEAVSTDSLEWTVNETGSSTARIRVTSGSISTISDMSNANFTIRTPSLTLTSPNGGEAWDAGTTRVVRWTRSNLDGPMNLYVNRNYPANEWTPFAVSVNADTFAWVVSAPFSNTARVRVTSSRLAAVSDESNANFTIGTAIVMTAPQGGETWNAGTTQTVSWSRYNAAGAATVQVNRSFPSAAWETLNAAVATSSYAWTVSGNASTTVRVRIYLNANPAIGDTCAANLTIAAPGLLLTVPNGGETWPIGTQQTITWSRNNVPGNMTVQLNRSYPSSTWETLTTTVSGNSFPWIVTPLATASARVRIYLTGNPSVSDTCNANFSILAQGLTLAIPNGGEQWAIGAPQTITFSRVNADGAATIQLKRSYPGGTWENLNTNLTDTSLTWTPSGTASATCRVRLYLNSNSSVGDTSNANFSLVTPVLTVTAPNGGELWGIGSMATITWTRANAAGPVTVSLNRNYPSGTWEVLAANDTLNSLSWQVAGTASATARVRITLNNVPTVMDESNANFSIVQPALNLTTPDGGGTYMLGAQLAMRWTRAAAPGAVTVLLNRTYPTGAWELLTSSVTADSFLWTASGNPSTTCRVRIRLAADSTISDVSSGNFTLQSRTLTVTAPNGGEALYTGSVTPVTFVRNNATTNVTVQVNRTYPSGNWETLATTVSGSSFNWNVTGSASNTARIRVFLTAEPTIGDTSDGNFVIVMPSLVLTAPIGGEQWPVGSAQTVIWQRNGAWDNVRVEVKRNYPSGSWEVLSASVAGNFYNWTVTGPATTGARLRVISAVNSAIADTSNAAFSITTSQITLTAPNGGESLSVGSPYVIRWTRSMAAGDARVLLNRTYPYGTWDTLGTTTSDSLPWTVTGPASTTARIKVFLMSDATVGDTCAANFTILQPSLTLIAPQGGEIYRVGWGIWIIWMRTGVNTVDVLLNRNYPDGAWEMVTQNIAANQYAWTVNGPPSTACRLKVQSHDNPSVNDVLAGNFEIQQPHITLTTPAPGDTFAIGVANAIRWTRNATATDTVLVELDTNYPSGNWITLDTTATSDVSWIATTPPTFSARLRLVSVSSPNVSDTLSGNFAIQPASLHLTSPLAGDTFTVGGPIGASWRRSNVSAGASVLLSRDGSQGPWDTLAANVSADNWSGVVSGPRSSSASLRVVSTHIPALADTVAGLVILEPALSLLSPNGGTVGAGTVELVRCTRTDFSRPVSFEVNFHYPNSAWHPIAANVVGDSVAWNVPDSVTTHARVRVRSTIPALEDVSDSDITIANPRLVLVSPNGGDSLALGLPFTVHFSRIGAQGCVKAELNRYYPDSAWVSLADSILADSLVWTASGTPSDHARVRVSLLLCPPAGDTSDSDFHIVQPSLVLLTPAAGDSLALTLPAQFAWAGTGSSGGVSIQVKRLWPAGSWETLASNIIGNSWAWIVTGSPSDSARFRIFNSHNPAICDSTDGPVRIGQPQFLFTQPQSADTFLIGERITLAWNRRFVSGPVRVEVSRGGTGGPWEQIGITDGNSFPWTVSAPASNIVRFRVTLLSASWVAGMTPFNCTILAPALTFTSPAGSGVDTVGTNLDLAWQWTNTSGAVRLEVSRDSLNGTWQVLSDSLAGLHYTFAVTEPETDSLRFRVTSLANPTIFALSPVRRVVMLRRLDLHVHYDGGTWYIGQHRWISWSRTNYGGMVNLEMTNLDRSQPWTPLAQTTADSFLWTVTGPEADLVALRVMAAQRPEVMDTTDAPLYIRQPYVDVLEPNGGDTLAIGQDIRLRWIGVGFPGGVAIGLYRGAPVDRVDTLSAATPNDSSQIWHITGPAASNCMLIIVSTNDTTIFDTSSSRFTIIEAPNSAEEQRRLPREYKLCAPYPNPFNSTCTLEFALPHDGHVTLIVYDMLGREVAVLANDQRQAGAYRLAWNAQSMATGTYFVRMTSGQFVAIRKVQLIK